MNGSMEGERRLISMGRSFTGIIGFPGKSDVFQKVPRTTLSPMISPLVDSSALERTRQRQFRYLWFTDGPIREEVDRHLLIYAIGSGISSASLPTYALFCRTYWRLSSGRRP